MRAERRIDDPRALLQQLCRCDFSAFLRKAWPHITGGDPIAWNWHLEAIAFELARVLSGSNLRLLVTLPPRNGKSKTISVIWVAWMLGQDPKRNFVCVSYSNELSAKLARDCLSIMQAAWYREIFPGTIVSAKRFSATDFETTAGGGRLATSVSGTLTGRGGDIIILDDVIKPEEASSETSRTFVNGWYQSTLASRLNDKASGAIICVMQRLHQDDLAGVLLETGNWHELKLPAIATDDEVIRLSRGRVHYRRAGDALHPEREPLAVLEQTRQAMGSYAFSAQYQQDPVPVTGNVIRSEWLATFDPATFAVHPGQIVQSWDTASKDNPHNDWSVCITALVRGQKVYILDVLRRRMQLPDLIRTTIGQARKFKAQVLLVEDQASGTQLIQTLRAQCVPDIPLPIGRRPETDKLSRALGMSAMIEAGHLHHPVDAPWVAEFRSELLAFPNSRFDDQVDALSQLLIWVRNGLMFADDIVGAPIFFELE